MTAESADRGPARPAPLGRVDADGGSRSLRIVVVAVVDDGPTPAELLSTAVHAARRARPDAAVSGIALSDGGPGFVETVATPEDRRVSTEVAGPFGHPRDAVWLLRPDGTAVLEASSACGVRAAATAPAGSADQAWRGSSYGVGQLLDAARATGATRIVLGVAGIGVRDAGAGALGGLGLRMQVEDGSGLKIGADELHRLSRIDRGWEADWSSIDVRVVADRSATFRASSAVDGDAEDGEPSTLARSRFADVVERDFGRPGLADEAMSASGNGAALALCAATGARLVDPCSAGLELSGAGGTLADADLVIVVGNVASAVLDDACRTLAPADGGIECVEVRLHDPGAVGAAAADGIRRSVAAAVRSAG